MRHFPTQRISTSCKTNTYLSQEWMLFPFIYDSQWLNFFLHETFGLKQIASDSGLLKASVLQWKIFLTQCKKTVSSLDPNPRLSSCLWEQSIVFQGKAIQSHKERMRGWMKAGWMEKWKKKKKWGREQTCLGDVWRFLCVAESIHPCLSVLLLLLFLPLALGVDKTPDAYAGKAQHQLQNPSDFPHSTPNLLYSTLSLSCCSQMSLVSFSPAALLPCYSL